VQGGSVQPGTVENLTKSQKYMFLDGMTLTKSTV